MNKKALSEAANISMSVLAKMGKGETVTVETLVKICNAINCEVGDIIELIETE